MTTDNDIQNVEAMGPQERSESLWQKLYHAKMQQGWQWLVYIDLIFPGLLFVLALLPVSGLNHSLAGMFHLYTRYVLTPLPSFVSLTGILAPLLHLGLLLRALIRRKWLDAGLCLLLFALLVLFFHIEINGTTLNYYILRFLDFGLSNF